MLIGIGVGKIIDSALTFERPNELKMTICKSVLTNITKECSKRSISQEEAITMCYLSAIVTNEEGKDNTAGLTVDDIINNGNFDPVSKDSCIANLDAGAMLAKQHKNLEPSAYMTMCKAESVRGNLKFANDIITPDDSYLKELIKKIDDDNNNNSDGDNNSGNDPDSPEHPGDTGDDSGWDGDWTGSDDPSNGDVVV